MRRTLTRAALLVALLAGGTSGLPETSADQPASHVLTAAGSNANGRTGEQCRYARADDEVGWTNREILLAIGCAVDRWNVPGGVSGAECIARLESGLNEHARNGSSSAGGVYQWLSSSWDGAYHSHPELTRRWELRDSRFNARAAIVISVRVAHDAWSWWPTWSVADNCGLA